MPSDAYHQLLSTRYVCEACLTRYFNRYSRCRACGQMNRIVPLKTNLFGLAKTEEELRGMIAGGQRMGPLMRG